MVIVYNELTIQLEIQKWEEDFSVVEPNDFINLKNSLTKIIEDAFSLLEVFIGGFECPIRVFGQVLSQKFYKKKFDDK